MTDDTNDNARAERIRRLQERRGTTAVPRVANATGTPTGPAPAPRGRRRHPAAATRWMLAGLSIASFFGIGGTIIAANRANVAAAPAANPSPAATNAAPAAQPTSATPRATTLATTAPHTTTGGS